MAASRFDHANIVVADMDAALRFYTEVVGLTRGFEGTLEGPWIDAVTGQSAVLARCVFVESPGQDFRLELLQYICPAARAFADNSLPQVPGIRHLAFTVSDMDAFYRHAVEMGTEFVSSPVDVPFLLPGGRRKRLCYFHDPDGTLLEAAEYS